MLDEPLPGLRDGYRYSLLHSSELVGEIFAIQLGMTTKGCHTKQYRRRERRKEKEGSCDECGVSGVSELVRSGLIVICV